MPQNKRPSIDPKKIRSLLAAGKPPAEIARRLNVTVGGVTRYLQRNGLKAPHPNGPRFGGVERIRPLAAKGMTAGEIAKVIGCTPRNVRAVAERHGVTLAKVR